MAIIEWLSLIGLGVFLGILLRNKTQIREQQQQLDEAFYQLIEAQNGKISLIQLAARARVDAQITQQYLDRQVQIFSAMPEADEEGNTFYQFPQLRLPPNLDKQW